MGSRDKDHTTPHQPLLSSLVVRATDSGGGGAAGGSDYEPGEKAEGSFPVGYNIVIFVFLIWRGVCSSLDITGFFFQGIEFVQVLVLLCAAGMQITATVRILIVGWAYHVVVDLVVGDLLVDIETIHPLMAVEEDVAAGFQIEDLMGLDLLLDHSEMMGYLEIILMYVQEKEIGCALIRVSSLFLSQLC
ncbi:hypothetical protein C3L33_03626, partial [Rhododendron williamsianum]